MLMNRMHRIIILGLVAVLLGGLGCSRGQTRDKRPLMIIPDMEFQKKVKAQTYTPVFEDGRAMRTPPEGTVARGTFHPDSVFYAGRENGEYITHNPRPLDRELLNRGRDRYNIFCAPCHDQTGEGKGIVVDYGLVPPPSFHDPRVVAFTDGYMFEVISNGVRNMPGYRRQIPTEDRWAVVAYLRALQRSRLGTIDDVPADKRQDLR